MTKKPKPSPKGRLGVQRYKPNFVCHRLRGGDSHVSSRGIATQVKRANFSAALLRARPLLLHQAGFCTDAACAAPERRSGRFITANTGARFTFHPAEAGLVLSLCHYPVRFLAKDEGGRYPLPGHFPKEEGVRTFLPSRFDSGRRLSALNSLSMAIF